MDTGTTPSEVSPSAVASNSSMKKGTPSPRRTTVLTRSGVRSTPWGTPATSPRTAGGRVGWRSIGCTTRRASSAAIRSAPGPGSSSRMVATTNTGSPARLSARYSTTVLVSGSDQCTSSMTKSVGASGADHSPSRRNKPSARTIDPPSRQGHAVPLHSGTSAANAGRKGVSSDGGQSPVREAARSASRNGRSGTSAAVGLHLPTKTIPAAALAQLVSSLVRRLLPIPALPRITSMPPPTRQARCSSESSCSRPTMTGQKTCWALELRAAFATRYHATQWPGSRRAGGSRRRARSATVGGSGAVRRPGGPGAPPR